MQFPAKGGRLQKFPHGITHVRVQVPIKPTVKLLVERYKQIYGSDDDPHGELMMSRFQAFLAQDINQNFEE